MAELIAHIKSGPIFKPAQLHIIGIQLFHDFFTLAEGGIHPTAQAVTPALDGTSKIRTEDGINGRSQRLKHGKNSVRQIEEQAANCPNRIIEYISDEVCNGSHKVIDHHKYIHNQVPQGNEDVSDECQRRHKCAANQAGCGNACTGKLIDRRHSRIEQGYKGDHQNDDPYQGASIQGRIQAVLCRRFSGGGRCQCAGCGKLNHLCPGHSDMNSLGNKPHSVCGHLRSIVHQQCAGHTIDDRGKPRPVIYHQGGTADQKVKNPSGNRSDPGKAIDNPICNLGEPLAISNLIDFGQDRGKDRQGLVLHTNPNLRPSLGHI